MPATRKHTLIPATTPATCVMGVGNHETLCGAPATHVHEFEWHLKGQWRPQSRPMCERNAGTVARTFRLPGASALAFGPTW